MFELSRFYCIFTRVFILSTLMVYDVLVLLQARAGQEYIDNAEVRHVAFLKIHKTGSSTVQNIFLRFGYSRNLTFLMPSVKNNDCRGMSNCISFYQSLNDDIITPVPPGKHFEIMCSHVVYDRKQFRTYLPRDTKLIALIREPVSRLASAIAFFRLLKKVTLTEFVKNPFQYDGQKLNNVMAFEFGFKKDWFLNETKANYDTNDLKAASKYARHLMHDFELIMLNERMDESLVLMKRLLRWRTQDILYQSKLSRKHDSFVGKSADKLREYLYLDYLIYDMAVEKFNKKKEATGPGFDEEVDDFKAVNTRVIEFCTLATENVLVIERSKWHEQFIISEDFCSELFRREGDFFDILRLRQYGTLDTY